MRSIFLSILFVLTLSFFANAKKLDSLKYENHKEFFLNWDNDIFVFKDFYYTQGAHLYYANPGLRKNPVNHLLFRLKNADNYYGLGLIQEIYTPKDVNDTLMNLVDRPYAGTLFFRSFSVSSNPDKKLRLTAQLDLGILGPLAGAEQAQKYIHEWLDLGFPSGWDFQIQNRPYINYNNNLEKGLITIPGVFDLIGNTRLRVGNIYDDIQVGASTRLGRINDYFKALNLSNKKYSGNRDFQFNAFAAASVTGVLYNATLMGGIIPPENHQLFQFRDIKHVVGRASGGLQMYYKFVSVKGQLTWKTPDFEGGESHGWGTISMYFRL